ncbi:MAG: hypothetical protein RMJ56_17335 [Gemmataceae bacterium]|nr:hypothetical protein [Gemmata sp.]MDW8199360.1 hypothetical protein [Gemmataceae bacterium]
MTRVSDWATNPHPDELVRLIHPGLTAYYSPYVSQNLSPLLQKQLQLFGCACARSVWQLLTTEARSAIHTRERFLYHQATEADLRAAALNLPAIETTAHQHAHASAARAAGYYHRGSTRDILPHCYPLEAARSAAKALACQNVGPAPAHHHPSYATWHQAWSHAFAAARAIQAHWLRDIIFPPGEAPYDIEPGWLTEIVRKLTEHADNTGDYSVLPILADALHEAGCDNDTLLRHCREHPHHVRGCWVVEQLLGRYASAPPNRLSLPPHDGGFDFVPSPHDDGTRRA